MFFKNKEIDEEELKLEEEYNYFISLGNGIELSDSQCKLLNEMEYNQVNNLLGKLLRYNEKLGHQVFSYYDKNIYNLGINKHNIKKLKYMDAFTKDALELMLNIVDESKREELLIITGKINSSQTKVISHFSDKMICIASLVLNELSSKGYESSSQLREIIDNCVESRLTNEMFEGKKSIKELIFYFLDNFKYNLSKKTVRDVMLDDYINEIIEKKYKDTEELKEVLGSIPKTYVYKIKSDNNN